MVQGEVDAAGGGPVTLSEEYQRAGASGRHGGCAHRRAARRGHLPDGRQARRLTTPPARPGWLPVRPLARARAAVSVVPCDAQKRRSRSREPSARSRQRLPLRPPGRRRAAGHPAVGGERGRQPRRRRDGRPRAADARREGAEPDLAALRGAVRPQVRLRHSCWIRGASLSAANVLTLAYDWFPIGLLLQDRRSGECLGVDLSSVRGRAAGACTDRSGERDLIGALPSTLSVLSAVPAGGARPST